MIDRSGNRIVIHCDSEGCQEAFEGDEDEEWGELWPRAKADGWKTRKIAGEWLHGCPDCGVPK